MRGRGGKAFDRDWTKGSIIRNLLSLSWPIMVSNSLNMLGPTIDMIWVSRLGSAAIAGVGVAGMAVMVINSARMGINTGTRALVARFIGAGETESARHVARQAFIISAVFAIFMLAAGVLLAEPVMELMGVEADVVSEGAAYMRIMFIASVFMSFRMMAEGIMQASGDSVNPMRIVILFRFFHLVLCPFLVFGWWIFPQLGVSGAALTNVLSQSLGMIAGLWILFSGRSRLKLTMQNFRFDSSTIWRIVKIGIPASITGIERSFSNLILTWFVVPFGTFSVAAHALLQRIEMILFMPGFGLGIGAGVLGGQNLGAHQPQRAERGIWLAVILVEGFMLIASMIILICAEGVINIFSSEPELVDIAGTFLR
ncbi:MAG: MATE family efflux transporter, partial [Dehalococcoidales bacterium]|nr:MATE family efflux transporter [Dehalococcoidales bacterium]